MSFNFSTMWSDVVQPLFQRPARFQVAALCYRKTDSGKEILLITSRDTGRWIVPKGWPIDGLDGAGSAAQEAWEEAGVKGQTRMDALGEFSYEKGLDSGGVVKCRTRLYPLEVMEVADTYPEQDERERRWVDPIEAANMVTEPELKALISDF